MPNKMINIEWEFFKDEDAARQAIIGLQKEDEHDGDESADLIDDFNVAFAPFAKDSELKWDKDQPLMIKWKVRIDASKDIADVVIDKDISVMKSYEELLKQPTDESQPYDYTINEEIINEIRMVLIEEYENEVPFEFNEIFTIFEDDEKSFGFDVYQLNATDTDGDVHIIDTTTAIESGVFDKIKTQIENRVDIKTVE